MRTFFKIYPVLLSLTRVNFFRKASITMLTCPLKKYYLLTPNSKRKMKRNFLALGNSKIKRSNNN